MSYTAIPVEVFPGVDTNANDGDGAGDAVNVRVGRSMRLKTRPGYTRVNADAYTGATSFLGIHYQSDNSRTYTVSEDGVRRYALGFATYLDDAKTGLTGSAIPVAITAHLTDETTYFACETDVIQEWITPVGLIDVATSPNCKYLCWMPQESRIIAAYAGFGSTNGSTIVFSDPGGGVWPAANTLSLEPQDRTQDEISGLCSWRDDVYVFKANSFYVLTGSSESASGAAIMNYRAVHTDTGCAQPNAFGTASGPDGVYFIGADGIYRTQGGPPELVSGPLQRWWDGYDNGLFSTAASARDFTAIRADAENVYVLNATAGLIFVYSTLNGQWSVYDLPLTIKAMGTVGLRDFLFCDDTGRLYRSTEDDLTDVDTSGTATAISWRYQTSFQRFGDEGEKVLREVKVEGHGGPIGLGVVSDWSTTDPTIVNDLTLGTAPNIAQARYRVAARGRNFSCVLEGDGPASIERLVYEIRDARADR